MFISDIHFGSPQCDIKRFLANRDYCYKNRIYVMLGGDLLETGTRYSVGAGVYEQTCNVQEQHEQMVEWIRPLAESNLVLGAHIGNHCERVLKESGVNITKAMCRELKIPYLGDACWSQFKVGRETYNIYSLHGRSNARFDGTALLAVERISTSFHADLVAHSHMHKAINSIVVMQRVVNGLVVEHKKHLLVTGAYLKYDQSYGQALGMPISKLGSPKIKFFDDKHDLSVTW
jgi:UDP-2,3-diacylglucosamine pyrophosphatase LpxH